MNHIFATQAEAALDVLSIIADYVGRATTRCLNEEEGDYSPEKVGEIAKNIVKWATVLGQYADLMPATPVESSNTLFTCCNNNA